MLLSLLIDHIAIYWSYCYYILYTHNIDKKFYIPKLSVVYNVIVNQSIAPVMLYITNNFFNIIDFDHINNKQIDFTNFNMVIMLVILIDIFVMSICHSIYFYIAHRMFHINILYKNIHYIHHRNIITLPYTVIDAHILEHIFINIFSVVCGLIIWDCHRESFMIWIWIATISSVKTHSCIIRKNSPKKHDLHHLLKHVNYGSGYKFMDKLFNTYKVYEKKNEYNKH